MRAAIIFFLALMTCPLLLLVAPASEPTATLTPTLPTITPAADFPVAHVEISADQTTVRVGDTVTISAVPVMIGLSAFTIGLRPRPLLAHAWSRARASRRSRVPRVSSRRLRSRRSPVVTAQP